MSRAAGRPPAHAARMHRTGPHGERTVPRGSVGKEATVDLAERQRIEIEFWRDAANERPGADSVDNVVNKVTDAGVFLECLRLYEKEIRPGRIVELGGGQGWVSCLVKRLYPEWHVVATDLSEYAIASIAKWEALWGARVDEAYACPSDGTRERDASADTVFCFASAHHFATHRKTLCEIARVLKPGGVALYFHEPTCPRPWYGIAYRRVNRIRPEVPEDVLVPRRIRALAREAGLAVRVDWDTSLTKRGPVETLYYAVLRRVALLRRLMPCTAHFVFHKAGGSPPVPASPAGASPRPAGNDQPA